MWLLLQLNLTLNPNLSLTFYYIIDPPLYSKDTHSIVVAWRYLAASVLAVADLWYVPFELRPWSVEDVCCFFCCSNPLNAVCLSPVSAVRYLLKRLCPYLLCGGRYLLCGGRVLLCGCLRRPRPFYYCCVLLRVPLLGCWGCRFMLAEGATLSFAVCAEPISAVGFVI